MPVISANAIDICFEVYEPGHDGPLGGPTGTTRETVVFVSGLGSQMITWEPEFFAPLLDAGHRVVRFDNRDVGLSSKVDSSLTVDDLLGALGGAPVEAPYLLSDMAADLLALLDALGLDRVHVVGSSMGGMIAQTFAIEHRDRLASLTSIMSTTGEPDVGAPDPAILGVLLAPSPADRDGAIEHTVTTHRAIGSPTLFDEERARRKAALAYDRCHHPRGTLNQIVAIALSGDRAAGLAALDAPTLVIHGEADPLVGVSGGRRTAELVVGSTLQVHDEMGHDIPSDLWPEVTGAIAQQVARA